jgi:ribosomal protein L29
MKYLQDIASLENEALRSKLEEFKKEYMFLRFQKKLGGVAPHAIKKVRKNIARVLTEMSKRKKSN